MVITIQGTVVGEVWTFEARKTDKVKFLFSVDTFWFGGLGGGSDMTKAWPGFLKAATE